MGNSTSRRGVSFIEVLDGFFGVVHVLLRFPGSFFLRKSLPFDKEFTFPLLLSNLLDGFHFVFFFSVDYIGRRPRLSFLLLWKDWFMGRFKFGFMERGMDGPRRWQFEFVG